MRKALDFVPALDRPHLLAPPVRAALERWSGAPWADQVQVAEIDPAAADSHELCERYGFDPAAGGTTLVVQAIRGGLARPAAVLVPVGARADLGGRVRRHLATREVRLMDRRQAVAATGMQHGSITVIGLPPGWPVLVDAELAGQGELIVGSGLVRSKIKLPAKALVDITGAMVTSLRREVTDGDADRGR